MPQVLYYLNGGGNGVMDTSNTDLGFCLQFADNVYTFPAFSASGFVCKTSLTPSTFMRAPGVAQSLFVTETAMQHMASFLGETR